MKHPKGDGYAYEEAPGLPRPSRPDFSGSLERGLQEFAGAPGSFPPPFNWLCDKLGELIHLAARIG